MYDSDHLLKSFHNSCVSLTQKQSQDMQKRRDTNLSRVSEGLKELDKASYVETINQGGNAMRTMTQPPENDDSSRYDIDVGVVFEETDAKTPATTKGWVCSAIAKKGQNLKTDPEMKKKCVRVVYKDGYQVDLPVFRRREANGPFEYEIAIGEEWKSSDPKSINRWLEEEIKKQSPDEGNGYQLRRIIRLIKYFAKVHAAKTGLKFPAGLVATAIAVECYVPKKGRDDEAFYETLKQIRDHSEYSSVMANGTVVSDEKDIDRIRRLRDAASVAVEALSCLNNDSQDLEKTQILKAWKKVFSNSFFDSDEAENSLKTESAFKSSGFAGLSPVERLQMAEERAQAVEEPTRPWLK